MRPSASFNDLNRHSQLRVAGEYCRESRDVENDVSRSFLDSDDEDDNDGNGDENVPCCLLTTTPVALPFTQHPPVPSRFTSARCHFFTLLLLMLVNIALLVSFAIVAWTLDWKTLFDVTTVLAAVHEANSNMHALRPLVHNATEKMSVFIGIARRFGYA